MWTILLFSLLSLLSFFSQAYSSFESSIDVGYHRDIEKKSHGPFLYKLSYLGFYEGAKEGQIELSLYNDFSENKWTPLVSKVLFIYPLDQGFDDAPFRKSRIQIGRQLLADGFDFYLLDGVTVPYYFSQTSGVNFFLGQTQDMDISESLTDQIYGLSYHQNISPLNIKVGSYSKGTLSFGSYLLTQASLPLESLWLQPVLMTKWEWDLKNQDDPQTLNMIDLNIHDNLSVYFQHSFRNPKPIQVSHATKSIYDYFSKSYSETQEVGFHNTIRPGLDLQGFLRSLRFKTGVAYEATAQEELRIDYSLTSHQTISPFFAHILGYEGELWSLNMDYQNQVSDLSKWYSDLSIAYIYKINQIHSWLYQFRSGYETRIQRRWTLALWGEMERNQIFSLDSRIKGNVAYFY